MKITKKNKDKAFLDLSEGDVFECFGPKNPEYFIKIEPTLNNNAVNLNDGSLRYFEPYHLCTIIDAQLIIS